MQQPLIESRLLKWKTSFAIFNAGRLQKLELKSIWGFLGKQ